MKKLLAGLAVIALMSLAPPAQAGDATFHQMNVTKDAPLVGTVTTTAVGDLNSNAYVWGGNATFEVSGPLSCSQSVRDQLHSDGAACDFTDAPVGTYTFTVTPKGQTLYDVWVFVSGEF